MAQYLFRRIINLKTMSDKTRRTFIKKAGLAGLGMLSVPTLTANVTTSTFQIMKRNY